jgi:hypothetical protein
MYELLPTAAVVPLAYPLFKQCDPAWGDDRIQVKTVCAVGCLMSSTSMALRERGVTIPLPAVKNIESEGWRRGQFNMAFDATPGTLNRWLLANGGYVGHDNLDESAVTRLDPARIKWTNGSMHKTNDLTWASVIQLLDAGAAVIANVMHGHHFVLVVGYDASGDTLYVNDPGFNRPSYSFSNDVVGWRLYAIARDKTNTATRGLLVQLAAIESTRDAV